MKIIQKQNDLTKKCQTIRFDNRFSVDNWSREMEFTCRRQWRIFFSQKYAFVQSQLQLNPD